MRNVVSSSIRRDTSAIQLHITGVGQGQYSIVGTVSSPADTVEAARNLYEQVAQILSERRIEIVHERIFGSLSVRSQDLVYRDSHIFSVDIATGAVRQLTQKRGTLTSPRVSPDGRRIAFAGYEYTRQTYRTADLYLMNADGSGITLLSGAFDRAPAQIEWAADNSGVYFTAQNEGAMNIHFAPVGGGVRPVTTGTHTLAMESVTRTGVAIATRSTYHKPPDVVRINLKKPAEITS